MKARLSKILLGKELYRTGLTQEKFAESVGISARYVRYLCSEDANITVSVYHQILKTFNLPFGSLLIYVDEESHSGAEKREKKHGQKNNRSASVNLQPSSPRRRLD